MEDTKRILMTKIFFILILSICVFEMLVKNLHQLWVKYNNILVSVSKLIHFLASWQIIEPISQLIFRHHLLPNTKNYKLKNKMFVF